VLGSPSREQRSREKIKVVHCGGCVAEIGDLMNSGVHRVNAQVFGVKIRETRGHEATKWREVVSRPSEEDRWKRSVIS
jgi:hypothetical protein